MKKGSDSNYVSVWSWMFMMFITAIPIIGWIMIFVWAFTGENASRKNYYRAILAWMFIFIAIGVALTLLGTWPATQQTLHTQTHRR